MSLSYATDRAETEQRHEKILKGQEDAPPVVGPEFGTTAVMLGFPANRLKGILFY